MGFWNHHEQFSYGLPSLSHSLIATHNVHILVDEDSGFGRIRNERNLADEESQLESQLERKNLKQEADLVKLVGGIQTWFLFLAWKELIYLMRKGWMFLEGAQLE